MHQRTRLRIVASLGATVLAVGVSACSQSERSASTPVVEEKSYSLTPANVPVRVGFLSGELRDLKITQRVEQGTGQVVSAPKLSGTLKLKNTSEDQTARLIEGTIDYVDMQGALIPLVQGRDAPTFSFYSYQTDRLDPGVETTQSVDVPFPAAALNDRQLRDVRLKLAYIPWPYEEDSVDLRVSVSR